MQQGHQIKRAIITGPTGAIGTALIQNLQSQGIYVTAVCRRGSKRISHIPVSDQVKIIECSLDELHTLPDRLNETYDLFYHFAWDGTSGSARNDTSLQMKNIQYTLDAAQAAGALGCRRFIGAGSQAEYGRHKGKIDAFTAVFPENGYGMAKLCAGQMSRLRCRQLGIEHIWVRIFSVYGPYDGEASMVMSMIRSLLKGQRPSCTKGEQIWDYLYSKDAARAFSLLGEKGIPGKTYCLGSGRCAPLAEYIAKIRDCINPEAEIGWGDIAYGQMQVMHLCADLTQLKQDTGFWPEVSFKEGIRETAGWVQEHF